MTDQEFFNLQTGLRRLHLSGAFTVIFPLSKERKIRNGIFERYGERDDDKLFLANMELIFIG